MFRELALTSFAVSSSWRWNWSKCKAVFSEATDAVKSYPCLQLIRMENFFGLHFVGLHITRTCLQVSKLRAELAGVSFFVLSPLKSSLLPGEIQLAHLTRCTQIIPELIELPECMTLLRCVNSTYKGHYMQGKQGCMTSFCGMIARQQNSGGSCDFLRSPHSD